MARRVTISPTKDKAINCLIIHPLLAQNNAGGARGSSIAPPTRVPATRANEAILAEASGLAFAIGLHVVHAECVKLRRVIPSSLMGRGTILRISDLVKELDVGLVIIDSALTPVQQRNLEQQLHCKIIDRVGLILEIFGARAQTHEGVLQVELAALTYQRSRLVKSWTHLERQRGGFGFLGGPGESQLEIDRRLITDRITSIKRELENVRRTRGLHRQARARVPWPVVALAGYTNAGKSTLFNRLTDAKVMVADMVFATLDPTMREVKLPSGTKIMLSDTVGFISMLPTELIAAFRATLEEVIEADLILHVRDISHPDSAAQAADVRAVLEELGLEEKIADTMIEVWNKSDLCDGALMPPDLAETHNGGKLPKHVAVSALTGDGIAALLQTIDGYFAQKRQIIELVMAFDQGKLLAEIYQHGEVLHREDREDGIHIRVALDPIWHGRMMDMLAASGSTRRASTV